MKMHYEKISLANRNCPICGNNKDNRILWQTREVLPKGIALPEEVTVVTCNNCGFCYSDTPATMKQYDDYYANNNMYAGRSTKNLSLFEEERLSLVLDLFEKEDTILDMGTGGGKFLCGLKEKGYCNLYGMDVAKDNVNIIEKMGIRAELAGAYTPLMDKYRSFFDGVFLNTVLEHLLFPKAAIHNMREYLKLNGKMVIIVPDMRLVGAGNSHPSHHFSHEHINYFSIMSLDRLMQEEGFSKVYYKDFEDVSDVERVMAAVYEKKDNEKKEENIVDTISALAIERYLQKRRKRNIIIKQELLNLKDERLVLWGIGARMMQTMADADIKDINITRCVDGNTARWNSKIEFYGREYVIESPESIADKLSDDSIIVICCNSKQYEDEIRNTIQQQGLKNKVIIL